MLSIIPSFMFDKLDELGLEFEEHDKMISAGVASVGPASAYAEVWEWGNIRQTKPGPKTTLGTNPDGEQVWLTIQAPFGYIAINEDQYIEVLKKEIKKVKFSSTTAKGITKELEKCAEKAMKKIVEIISDHAPVDSGDLSKSFKVVKANDILLDKDDSRQILALDGE